MIFTDKIATNRLVQELLDAKQFTSEQIQAIHDVGCKIFAAGYDVGRLENPRWKPIVQLNEYGKVVEEFNSVYHAEKKTGIAHQNINNCVLGKRHTTGGYLWRFKNLEDYNLK